MQLFYRLFIPQRPRFLEHRAFIANRQIASQAVIFSVHETRKTHFHHAVRYQQ